ncbi:MAG: hypothetical protein ACON4H_04355 [Rubripirellula sp.]
MNDPARDDPMLLLESIKRVINASIVIALVGITTVVFLLHSVEIKQTTDELSRARATLKATEAESVRLSSETQELRQPREEQNQDAIRDFLEWWRDADDIPDFNSSRIIRDCRADETLWYTPAGHHRLEIAISKVLRAPTDPNPETGPITKLGQLPPPSAETLNVWTVPLVGDAGYHFKVILHSDQRQLKWNLSSNSQNSTSRSELIQNRESNKLAPFPFANCCLDVQPVIIPNEIPVAKYLRLNDGRSTEEKLAELRKLLETPSGVPLYAKRFISPQVTNGKQEATYVVARLVSDGPAQIAPSDAKKLIQSIDCQDLIEPHIYTEPYIYDESFEASQAK